MSYLFILIGFWSFAALAERDCLKEYHSFHLAMKISEHWKSELKNTDKNFEQICSDDDGDIDATIIVNRMIEKKAREEFTTKQTLTMGLEDALTSIADLEGEISNEDICRELDKEIKSYDHCEDSEVFLRSLSDFEYKDFKKMCLTNLPEFKKRIFACK